MREVVAANAPWVPQAMLPRLFEPLESAPQLSCPTLVIHGQADPLVPPAGGQDTARAIPGARLTLIPGMGHNIPDALSPVIAHEVLAFIAEH